MEIYLLMLLILFVLALVFIPVKGDIIDTTKIKVVHYLARKFNMPKEKIKKIFYYILLLVFSVIFALTVFSFLNQHQFGSKKEDTEKQRLFDSSEEEEDVEEEEAAE